MAYKPITILCISFMFFEMIFTHYYSSIKFLKNPRVYAMAK